MDALRERPERSADPLGAGACSLEDLADRIGGVIAWVVVALRREVAEERVELDCGVAEGVVRNWLAGLDPDARAYFLTLALSDRCYAECPLIVRAILEGLPWPWPGARSWGALDPCRCSCDAAPHAFDADEPGVRRLAGAVRVQCLAGRRHALRE
ncbi:MAG: hypothetical protein H0T76_01885 [Nannocystis sp.]|nr:hypothetical protein [Nannocystis sp.]MBA3545212.1 hypothetical protein [Nannocystis sp.]